MAMTTVTRFDTSDVQRTMRGFRTRFPKAIKRALKRAATTARAQLARDVAVDMKLKVGVVKDAITVVDEGQTVSIRASVKRLPLYDFIPGGGNPRGPYPSQGKRRLRVRGKTYPDAFIARMGTGHWGVFKRTEPSRLPIAELHGASVWQSATNNMATAQARGLESLQKNLASELNYAATLEGK